MANWQDRYLCPLVKSEKPSLKRIKKIIKDFFILLAHSLSFHEFPKNPPEELPEPRFSDENKGFEICKDMYKNADDRIDKLEEKALKLLTYVTALFAFVSFIFVNTSLLFTKIIIIISLALLLFTIIISFRCVNVKFRKTMFISDLYNFDSNIPDEKIELKTIYKKYLSYAKYNQNIADNTADILRTARNTLTLAIILSGIGFFIGIFSYINVPKINSTRIENLSIVEKNVSDTNKILNEINNSLKNQKITDDISTISKRLDDLEKRYESLNSIIQKKK
jgi:hypothetical protein